MRAAWFQGTGAVGLRQRATPEPRADEARVRIAFCGVCGSDLHRFRGDLPLITVTPGHELSGVVDAVGPDVTSLRVGDQVAVEPLVPCRACRYCHSGHHQLCPRAEFLAADVDGGFAEYVVLPELMLHQLPPAVSLAQAALAEPLAVALHALRLGGVGRGSTVCVLGAGTIGLLVLQAARASGAARVLITARYPHQAELARTLGADGVVDGDAEVAAEIVRLTDGEGADAVIETVGGHAPTPAQAVSAARRRGRVAIVGAFAAPQPFDFRTLVMKELTLVGSHTYDYGPDMHRDFEVALSLLATGAVNLDRFVDRKFPLTSIDDAFQAALHKRDGLVKALVTC
jgi:2-desacetyl-2-hydroxyethyl bacteriochlorophyllide A dehydrogenase